MGGTVDVHDHIHQYFIVRTYIDTHTYFDSSMYCSNGVARTKCSYIKGGPPVG